MTSAGSEAGRQRHRRPRPERPLAAAPTAHLQPFFPIQPAQLLVVHPNALARQQQAEPAIAEPPPLAGQRLQSGTNRIIARRADGGSGSSPGPSRSRSTPDAR